MTITETVLVFVGIPLAVIAIIYALVYGGSAARSKRYRPGRPFNSTAVWFVANTPANTSSATAPAHALAGSPASQALPGGTGQESATESGGAGELATVHYGETGGASDSW